jgi:hypothetical protein
MNSSLVFENHLGIPELDIAAKSKCLFMNMSRVSKSKGAANAMFQGSWLQSRRIICPCVLYFAPLHQVAYNLLVNRDRLIMISKHLPMTPQTTSAHSRTFAREWRHQHPQRPVREKRCARIQGGMVCFLCFCCSSGYIRSSPCHTLPTLAWWPDFRSSSLIPEGEWVRVEGTYSDLR